MRDGKIHFQDSDDDAVHLCHSGRSVKGFTARGYEVVHFNRFGSRWRAVERVASDVERVRGPQAAP